MLAGQGGLEPSLHQLLAGAGDGVDAGIQRLGDPAVAPGFAGLRGIGLQQDACLQHLARGTLPFWISAVEPFPLVIAELDDVLSLRQVVSRSRRISGATGDIDSEIDRKINDAGH